MLWVLAGGNDANWRDENVKPHPTHYLWLTERKSRDPQQQRTIPFRKMKENNLKVVLPFPIIMALIKNAFKNIDRTLQPYMKKENLYLLHVYEWYAYNEEYVYLTQNAVESLQSDQSRAGRRAQNHAYDKHWQRDYHATPEDYVDRERDWTVDMQVHAAAMDEPRPSANEIAAQRFAQFFERLSVINNHLRARLFKDRNVESSA